MCTYRERSGPWMKHPSTSERIGETGKSFRSWKWSGRSSRGITSLMDAAKETGGKAFAPQNFHLDDTSLFVHFNKQWQESIQSSNFFQARKEQGKILFSDNNRTPFLQNKVLVPPVRCQCQLSIVSLPQSLFHSPLFPKKLCKPQ